jgi:hypothetical protein
MYEEGYEGTHDPDEDKLDFERTKPNRGYTRSHERDVDMYLQGWLWLLIEKSSLSSSTSGVLYQYQYQYQVEFVVVVQKSLRLRDRREQCSCRPESKHNVGKGSDRKEKSDNQDQVYPMNDLIWSRIIGNRCIHRVVFRRRDELTGWLNTWEMRTREGVSPFIENRAAHVMLRRMMGMDGPSWHN